MSRALPDSVDRRPSWGVGWCTVWEMPRWERAETMPVSRMAWVPSRRLWARAPLTSEPLPGRSFSTLSILKAERASLAAQLLKNLPAMRETLVRFLDWEDPLEKGKATRSSILAWRIPWTIQSMGLQRVRHNWATFTFISTRLRSTVVLRERH